MNLAETAKMVHENAVAHGWWETERDDHELLALIHSEWSEALEEFRAGRPMIWFECADGVEAALQGCGINGVCKETHLCAYRKSKPEGIAVEIIDGCIRILDLLGHDHFFEKVAAIDDESLNIKTLDDLIEKVPNAYNEVELPELISWLHYFTAVAVDALYSELPIMRDDNEECIRNRFCTGLLEAFGIAAKWLQLKQIDFEHILEVKHNYNVSRPYRHGGKVC